MKYKLITILNLKDSLLMKFIIDNRWFQTLVYHRLIIDVSVMQ